MNWTRARALAFTALILMSVSSGAVLALAGTVSGQDTVTAELDVEQPRHVPQPVETKTGNGTRVYIARGEYLEIEPRNFNQSAVTSFAVQEDEGVLRYDKTDREYVLNTQGNAGTYHLTWTVSQNGQTTVYGATIRVVTADYRALTSQQYSQLKNDSRRGDEIINRFENAGDPDEPVSAKVDFSVAVLNFKNNPFSALTGQFVALQVLRFTTPAGWLDLGIVALLVYALTRGLYATIARFRKQLEREEQISRREDVQYLKMFKQLLSGEVMTDVDTLDEHQAAVLEDKLGPNLWTALKNFVNVWGPASLKRMYVSAMGAVGYSATVTRNAKGEITDITVLDPEDPEPYTDGGEGEDGPQDTLKLSQAPSDVVDALEWEQVDSRVFERNPGVDAVDHLMVANRERDDDLIAELNISIPNDFQSREAFMMAIGQVIKHVQQSEFVDDDGYAREDRAVLNNVFAFTSTLDDLYGVPIDLYWRACLWNAEGLNRDDEARTVLKEITDGEDTLDDLDLGGGVGDT